MIVGVPREAYPGERRVSLAPGVVPSLLNAGLEVHVDAGAGAEAGFSDSEYEARGARIAKDRTQLISTADVLLCVHGLGVNSEAASADLELVHAGQTVLGLLDPLGAPEATRQIADAGMTAFALELLPRISRAQSMDVLSSMATVAGYKAALLAAEALPRIYPMMITAAGTITPARIFVVGAGVAGLQAIATSRRLGGVVQAYDVRAEVREQVESLGARFLEIELDTSGSEGAGGYARDQGDEFYRRQREMMANAVSDSDVVITTAAIPGRPAPVLITEEMVRGMRSGSVVLDLAAEGGGNCELTRPGETVEAGGVNILGPLNLPSTVPYHASQMLARNVTAFLLELVTDGEMQIDMDNPIVSSTLIAHEGEVVNSRVRELLDVPTAAETTEERSIS